MMKKAAKKSSATPVKSKPVVHYHKDGSLWAKGQEVEIEQGLASGALEYIVKPFAPDELASQVKDILQRVGALD